MDRTAQLSRELLHRLRSLEIALRDNALPGEGTPRRQKVVLKCFRDEGVELDPDLADEVLAVTPALLPNRQPDDEEVRRFAEALEQQFGLMRN